MSAPFEGVVLDGNGAPIKGARVSDGSALAITGADGIFSFEAGAIERPNALRVSAAGYRDHRVTPADFDPRLIVRLDLRPVRALYLPPAPLAIVRRMAPHVFRSDHAPFWEAGIPALMWTDTAEFRNPNYHGPADTPETLDYEFLAGVARLLIHAALSHVGP